MEIVSGLAHDEELTDCCQTIYSLKSLVSSDEISLDINGDSNEIGNYDHYPEEIPSTIRHRMSTSHDHDHRQCHHRYHHRVANQRSVNTEMFIIASSSPEIKALSLPITTLELPEEINCTGSSLFPSYNEYHHHTTTHQHHHQSSMSTCYLFPEDFDCDSFSISTKSRNKCSSIVLPAVSPIGVDRKNKFSSFVLPAVSPSNVDGNNNKNSNNNERLVEYRDQGNYHAMNRCERENDQRDANPTKMSHNNEVDELTLYLERQSIGLDNIHSQTILHKDDQIPSPTTVTPETILHPFKRGSLRHPRPSFMEKRTSVHRRISFDSLPEISEILDQPDLLSLDGDGSNYFSSETFHHDNSSTSNENKNDIKSLTIYY